MDKISELQKEPFPRGIVKLHGEQNVYRLRIGDYRVLYEFYPQERVILVTKIDHRSAVYAA